MEVHIERHDGVAVVSVSGEVDRNTSPAVREALLGVYAGEPAAVVVDLSGVTYIDSSGIATLTEGLQWATRGGLAYRLAGLGPAVRDVFALARLEHIFEIAATREAALEGLV